jgi:hypothetical protein
MLAEIADGTLSGMATQPHRTPLIDSRNAAIHPNALFIALARTTARWAPVRPALYDRGLRNFLVSTAGGRNTMPEANVLL